MLYEVIESHHNNQLKRNLRKGQVVDMSKEDAEKAPGLLREAKKEARPTPSLGEMKKLIIEKKLCHKDDLASMSELQIAELYQRAQ